MTALLPARIVGVTDESADTRTFDLALAAGGGTFDDARPGQFAMLSVLGHGAAAFTLSALPRAGGARGHVVVTVRRVGRLTTALFALPVGGRVWLDGPFGHGFPTDAPDVPTVYVAGGCGLSPLKAAIDVQLATRSRGVPLAVLYGTGTPETRIHRVALAAWARQPDVFLIETVEHPDGLWSGRTGRVAEHVDAAVRAVAARRAAVCGPPAMMAEAARRLDAAGLAAPAVYLALERRMTCGVGICGHCYLGSRQVCTDGPVFTLAELRGVRDARREVDASLE